jgi:hypothetical protein
MNDVVYIPTIYHLPVVDSSFKQLANDCKAKNKRLVVHLNFGHLNNGGFNLISKNGINAVQYHHLQQTIWMELADRVVFNHLDHYIVLKDRLDVNIGFEEKASA